MRNGAESGIQIAYETKLPACAMERMRRRWHQRP
jgi:hypothetical protein